MSRLHLERNGLFCKLLYLCTYLTENEVALGGLVHDSHSTQEAEGFAQGSLEHRCEEDREGRALEASLQDKLSWRVR